MKLREREAVQRRDLQLPGAVEGARGRGRGRRGGELQLEDRRILAPLLVADFRLSGEGVVSKSKVTGMKNKRLHTCIADIISAVRFPKSPDGKSMKVRYPLQLSNELAPPIRPGGSGGWGGIGSGFTDNWVLTRLHARYDQKSLSEDLVFKEA